MCIVSNCYVKEWAQLADLAFISSYKREEKMTVEGGETWQGAV